MDQAKVFSRIAHQLWVAGTLGALFGIAAKGVPVDVLTLSMHPELAFTLDRGLRWGYLIWLIAFFFVLNGLALTSTASSHQSDTTA